MTIFSRYSYSLSNLNLPPPPQKATMSKLSSGFIAFNFWKDLETAVKSLSTIFDEGSVARESKKIRGVLRKITDLITSHPPEIPPDHIATLNRRRVDIHEINGLLMDSGSSTLSPDPMTAHIVSSLATLIDLLTKQIREGLRSYEPNYSHGREFSLHDLEGMVHRNESIQKQLDATLDSNREILDELARVSKAKYSLEEALQIKTQEHNKAIAELQEQLTAEFKQTVETTTSDFVNEALEALEQTRTNFNRAGKRWSIAALIAFVIGIALSFYLAIYGTKELITNKDMQWVLLAFFSVKGAILLGLLFAVVSFCSSQGRRYMHESLKSAERKHAINYGKFYLTAFGAGAGNENVKEAFAQWNISTSSAFSTDTGKGSLDSDQFKIIEKLLDKLPSVRVNS